ncbi:hypothetical protein CROQUDRAFT_51219 [Cronartium quercuum f. sp. fusiforme G11]|uniref:Uncharacterized protein n=1 Tax=Cronartium quercuum f. sp. fusiforme G11 TaxID=708437 RepID=A0A9P6NCR3_9BASI|nr:hypothetical protein CROQUDRAFT_51219 [Cronartium quercuum f. sp. fusiforme G11]
MRFVGLVLSFAPIFIQSQSYDDQGSTLYITEPACAYYKCEVEKRGGDQLKINWLNSPSGNVKITLEGQTGEPTYTVTEKVPGTQSGCYKGDTGKRPCGQYSFTIPKNFRGGKYSVAITSLNQPDKIGYSDIVKITNPPQTTRTVSKKKKNKR